MPDYKGSVLVVVQSSRKDRKTSNFADDVIRTLREEFVRVFCSETKFIARTSKGNRPPDTFVDRSLYYFLHEEDRYGNDSLPASLTPKEFRKCVYRWFDCADRQLTTFAVDLCEMGDDIQSIERQLEEICLFMKNVEAPDWLLLVRGDQESMLDYIGEDLKRIKRKALKRATICVGKRDRVLQSREPVAPSPLQSVIRELMTKYPSLSYRDICGRVDDRCQTERRPIPTKCKKHGHETLVESIDCVDCRDYMKSFLSRERRSLPLARPPKSEYPQKTRVAKLHEVRN